MQIHLCYNNMLMLMRWQSDYMQQHLVIHTGCLTHWQEHSVNTQMGYSSYMSQRANTNQQGHVTWVQMGYSYMSHCVNTNQQGRVGYLGVIGHKKRHSWHPNEILLFVACCMYLGCIQKYQHLEYNSANNQRYTYMFQHARLPVANANQEGVVGHFSTLLGLLGHM